MVMDDGSAGDNDQAVAMCAAMYERKGKKSAEDETKVGARHSGADMVDMQTVHDIAVRQGAMCEPPKSHRKAITDAPNLRGERDQSCANCAYFKAMPPQETMMGDAIMQGICTKHDFMTQPNMVCDDWETMYPPMDGEKTLVSFGAEVKALGDGRVGGYLIRYGNPKEPDLEGDYFTSGTDYGVTDGSNLPVYYQHGMDGTLKNRRIGRGLVKFDEIGLWLEAQLELRDEYERAIYELAQAGKLGWSSGAAGHLVEREPVGKAYHIKSWPIAEGSLTPTPAEPRNSAILLKSLYVSVADPNESRATADGNATVTETASTANYTITVTSAVPSAKEIEMAENEKGGEVVTAPKIEIDYELLAAKVAEKLDVPGAAKSAPAVIRSENLGDPDPYRALANWARGGSAKGLGALGGKMVSENAIHFGGNIKAALQEASGEGAELVPDDFFPQIVAKRDEAAIARRAGAKVIQTSRDVLNVPAENASMAAFTVTAEEDAYTENEPTFTTAAITVYKFTKVIKVSEELLEDDATNLDSFLIDGISRAWAATENDYTLTGTGSSQPQGVFVGGSVGYTFADTNSIAATEIPALYWSLGEAYHNGASWVTKGAHAGSLQGLTGNNFQLVTTPYMPDQMQGDSPFPLWGKPVYLSDQVDAMTTGLKPIIFGNWNFYALVERRGLTISRNPYLYQANGQVGIFCSVRFGGAVLQSEAFKWGILA